MNYRKIIGKTSLITLGLIFVFCCANTIFAQMDEVLMVKQKAKTTIRPKAKPATKKVDIVRKVSISRVDKKNRKNYKKPTTSVKTRSVSKPAIKKIEVPLLAIQLKLMLVNKDGSEAEVNPLATFMPTDHLRLSVKANQRGYLYIIRQKSPEADGEIIFPSTLVNGGKNFVSANYEYILPTNCPKDLIPDLRDCSLTLFPYEESPQEFFTLIFTRDQLVGLPDDVTNTRISLANLMSAGKIEAQTLIDMIEDSNQDLVSQTGDTPFGVRIVNVNAKDNEEIIETFILNKVKK